MVKIVIEHFILALLFVLINVTFPGNGFNFFGIAVLIVTGILILHLYLASVETLFKKTDRKQYILGD